MLPLLLYWILRNYRKVRRHRNRASAKAVSLRLKKTVLGVMFLMLLLTGFLTKAQSRILNYTVKQNGDSLGSVQIRYRENPNGSEIIAESRISFRLLLKFSVEVEEIARFQGHRMEYSALYRKWNGHERISHQTRAKGNQYLVKNSGIVQTIPYFPVSQHMLQLYVREPSSEVSSVYSENLQRFVTLRRSAPHQFILRLPHGEYNVYEYRNGTCYRIRIKHSHYSAEMILRNPETNKNLRS